VYVPHSKRMTTSFDFLRAYSELVGLWQQPEATSEIVLQTLKIVSMEGPSPSFLWGLLFDLLPLLEAKSENCVLTTEEVHQLMMCLEEMWLSHQKALTLLGDNSDSQLRRLRMVLSQKLAGALFQS